MAGPATSDIGERRPARLAVRLAIGSLLTLAATACSSDKTPCGDGTFSASCVAMTAPPNIGSRNGSHDGAGDVTGSVTLRPARTGPPRATPQGTASFQPPSRSSRLARATQSRLACAPRGNVSVRLRGSPDWNRSEITGSLRPSSLHPSTLRPSTLRPFDSAATRPARSGWTWEGGTAVTLAPGDTVGVISRRYGVPVAAILEANGLSGRSAVTPGQHLVIPRYNYAQDPASPPAPTSRLSDAPVATSGPPATRPASTSAAVHTVAPGDTLAGVARQYGVSPIELASVNNLAPQARLRIGDQLMLPRT